MTDIQPLAAMCRGRRVVLVLSGAQKLPTPLAGDVVWAIGSGRHSVADRRIDVFHVRDYRMAFIPVNGDGASAVRWLRRRPRLRLECPQRLVEESYIDLDRGRARLRLFERTPSAGERLLILLSRLDGWRFIKKTPRPGIAWVALHLLDGLAERVVICGRDFFSSEELGQIRVTRDLVQRRWPRGELPRGTRVEMDLLLPPCVT